MFKLKLLQKELVLVAILLLLELVLIGTFKSLVDQSASEAASVEKSERIILLTNQIHRNLWDDTLAWAYYTITHNDRYLQRFKSLNTEMLSQVAALRGLAAEFPEDRATTEQLVQSFLIAKQREPHVEVLEAQGELEIEGKATGATERAHEFITQQWIPWIRKQIAALTDLSTHHTAVSEWQKMQVNRSKAILGMFLVLSALVQVVLAVGLVVFFDKSITRRLKILQDNSRRLRGGMLLHSRMRGADEIAELDSVFHEMAVALTESAIKERAIVDGMPAGFISLTADGQIQSVNPRTLEMLAMTEEQLIGRPITSVVVASDDSQITFQSIRTSALNGVTELKIVRTDGTIFPAELSISVIQNANQEQLMCNWLDVTERHDAERMKKEFVAMVSHDLRSPLTSISGFLYLLDGGVFGALDQRGKEVVTASKQETERVIRLVTNLLEIARMESGRFDLEKKQIDVSDIIKRSVEAVLGTAEEKKINIKCTSTHLQIVADPGRLVQVFVHLLSNAIKFSPLDSTIKISGLQLENEIELSVCDQGPGIAEAAQKRIFERFEQVSSNDRKEKDGSGLGLAICKLIVEAHGGTIGVESQLEKGSTFWLRMPLVAIPDRTNVTDVRDLGH